MRCAREVVRRVQQLTISDNSVPLAKSYFVWCYCSIMPYQRVDRIITPEAPIVNFSDLFRAREFSHRLSHGVTLSVDYENNKSRLSKVIFYK